MLLCGASGGLETTNKQIFCQHNADSNEVQLRMSEALHKRNIYNHKGDERVQEQQTPDEPPGFLVANIGQHLQAQPEISVQTDGSWDKTTILSCAAWVVNYPSSTQTRGQRGVRRMLCMPLPLFSLNLELVFKPPMGTTTWVHCYNLIAISTDSALLVHNLKSKGIKDIQVSCTIRDIQTTTRSFYWCVITNVWRQRVRLAHELATTCRRDNISYSNIEFRMF